MLLPLCQVNARQGVAYFSGAPDLKQTSYWTECQPGSSAPRELDAAGAAPLLGRAAAGWAEQGDRRLASLLPELLALHAAIEAEPPVDDAAGGHVPISVYPLF